MNVNGIIVRTCLETSIMRVNVMEINRITNIFSMNVSQFTGGTVVELTLALVHGAIVMLVSLISLYYYLII